MSEEAIIKFEKVNKWYGNGFHVLRDVDLSVRAGERIVICGPSGSGKSTLIRCINRLEEHQEGRIVVDGTELADDVKAVEAVRRKVLRRGGRGSLRGDFQRVDEVVDDARLCIAQRRWQVWHRAGHGAALSMPAAGAQRHARRGCNRRMRQR